MSRRAAPLFALASLAWGVPYLLAALTLDDLDPIVTVFGRAALAAIVMVPFVLRRRGFRAFRGRVGPLAWLALLDLTAPTLLITVGLNSLPSSVAGTLVAAVPLVIAGLAWRTDAAERASGWRLGGLVVGLGGVGVLLGFQVGSDPRALLGGVLVLAAAVCYAASALYYKRTFATDRPFDVVAGALVMCTLMSAVPAALAVPDHVPVRALGRGARRARPRVHGRRLHRVLPPHRADRREPRRGDHLRRARHRRAGRRRPARGAAHRLGGRRAAARARRLLAGHGRAAAGRRGAPARRPPEAELGSRR